MTPNGEGPRGKWIDAQGVRAPGRRLRRRIGAGCPDCASPAPKALIDQYCVGCHNQRLHTGGLDLESPQRRRPGGNAETWEKVIARLRAGSMPPPGRPRPDKATYPRRPSPSRRKSTARGRRIPIRGGSAPSTGSIASEYNNAVRDLFGIDPLSLDVKSLLPGDETADGSFDNFAEACRSRRRISSAISRSPGR